MYGFKLCEVNIFDSYVVDFEGKDVIFWLCLYCEILDSLIFLCL